MTRSVIDDRDDAGWYGSVLYDGPTLTAEWVERDEQRAQAARDRLASDLAEQEVGRDVCAACGRPWWLMRRRSLARLEDCAECWGRKLAGMKRSGGYAAKAATRKEEQL